MSSPYSTKPLSKLISAKLISAILLTLLLLSSTSCIVFPLKETDTKRSLYPCPPTPNCVSTEAKTPVHKITDFNLAMPLAQAWPIIVTEVEALPRTSIKHQYDGYIYARSHTAVFHFIDFFEVLAVPEDNRLMVRSSSMLGISDFLVNLMRTKKLRKALTEQGVIKPNE